MPNYVDRQSSTAAAQSCLRELTPFSTILSWAVWLRESKRDKGGRVIPIGAVQSCNQGQEFVLSKNGFDRLTSTNFCPWPVDYRLTVNGHTSWHPRDGPRTGTAWQFDRSPKSALTVWLHFDPCRSYGHAPMGVTPTHWGRGERRETVETWGEGNRERGGKYRVKLHGHTYMHIYTYMNNLTCMLLVWRMKKLVPVQQTS